MHRVNLKMELLVYQWVEAEIFSARKENPKSDYSVSTVGEKALELSRVVLNF